jgi:hypothetical protein
MYLCVENIGFSSFYVFVCWGYRFYLFLCICVLRISVLPLCMYLYVEDIGFTSFYVFVCWGYRFYLFLCICVLRILVLPLSMYLCIENIGFTSFCVFVYCGYRFYLFLCICVLRISVPQYTNTQKEVKPIYSIHKYIERGKTNILNTQIHRKR